MTTRKSKQVIYGALYIVLFFIIIGLLYAIFVRPFVSAPAVAQCTVNTCAPTSTAPIATSSVSIFATSPGHYTLLAQVVDTDPDYGAQALGYEFDLYDSSDTLIGTVPGTSFIYQSENKYLAAPNVELSSPVASAELVVDDVTWIPSSTLGALSLEDGLHVQNQSGSMSSSSIMVNGQLINSTIGSFEQVVIVALFNNGSGSTTGVSETELQNVQPQSTTDFSILYPAEPNIDPSSAHVVIYGLR